MSKKQLLLLSVFTFLALFGYTQSNASIEIVTQEKIQGLITRITYSSDGRLIASGSAKENSIKIWELSSGKIIGKLEGHLDETTALHFNHDGTQLFSAANDNSVIIWDLLKWEIIDSMHFSAPITAITIHDNKENTFYTGTSTGQLTEWNTTDFRHPKNLLKTDLKTNTIDQENDLLIVGSKNGRIVLFDLAKGQQLTEEKLHLGAIKGLNFYNDGKGLISAGAGGKIHLWDINDLSDSKHFTASATGITAYHANVSKNMFVTASQSTIKVWNLDGELIHEFKNSDNSPTIKALQISPDGSTIASSGAQQSLRSKKNENKNVIHIWDGKRGTLYQTLKGSVNPIYTFDFHPEKKQLVTLGDDRMLTFWDFDVAEKSGAIQLEEVKREFSLMADGTDKPSVKFDLQKGKGLFDKVRAGDIKGIATSDQGKKVGTGLTKRMFKERSIVKFSSKGTYLISKLKMDEIRLYTFDGDKPIYQQAVFSKQFAINQLLSSPNEKYLAVLGGGDSAVSIINLETKRFERKLSTPAPKSNLQFVYEANSLAFSPNGSLLAVCFNTGKTFVYNTSTWQLVFENILPGNLGYVESPFVNFSNDGKYMVVKTMGGIVKYDTQTFNIFTTEPLKIDGYSVPMDKPQDYAITIKEGVIYFENLFSGAVQKSIRVQPDQITNISINSDNNVGITFKSGQFILLNPASGKEEILLVANGDNYIFKTGKNFYKVSKEGRDLVTFRIGNNAYPFEQFDAVFNRPDKVLQQLNCSDKDLIALYEKAYQKRIKKLGLKPASDIKLKDIPNTVLLNTASIPAITENERITVKFKLQDQSNLSTYNIWINNVPVHGKNGKSITGKEQSLSEEIALIHGLNKVQIACRNSSGYESLIQTFYVEKEGDIPNKDLYLVTIGTSTYKDNRYNLTYPVKDAGDLIDLMKTNPSQIYANVKTKTLFNEDVTVKNVSDLKSFLKDAKPNDVVIVFVAGHGILDANFDYYFGTHNINFSTPAANGLAYEKLEQLLDGILANRKILIMDTCHSGEVDKEDVFFSEEDEQESDEDIAFRAVGDAVKEDKSKATPTRLAREMFNDLRKGTGATVISSAGGVEFAMESDEWKNGLFTYCMLNGLKNRTADLNKDGTIMLLELQEYVVEKVTLLSHGRQVPNSRIQNIELDFPIW